MTRQARTDLRDRMQRVAAKPATHPDTPRRTRSAPKSSARATRRRVEPEPIELTAPGPTRLETLIAWAQWEVMSVPRERFHYLKRLIAGESAGDRTD